MTGAWGSCISHGPLAAVVSLHSPRLPKSEHSSEKHPYRAWRWNTLFSKTKRNIIFPHRGIIVSRVILMSTLISIILRLLQGIKETRRSCVFNPIFSRLDYKLIIFSPREKKSLSDKSEERRAHERTTRDSLFETCARHRQRSAALILRERAVDPIAMLYVFNLNGSAG